MADSGDLELLLGEPSSFDDLDLGALQRRKSWKWSAYPPAVLPAFVAEMDLPLAPAVSEVLRAAISAGDCGYANDLLLPEAFAAFAEHLWSWAPDPSRMIVVPDAMAGVARSLEILTAVGDGVVLTPPVYGPFRHTIERLGRVVVEAPVVFDGERWRLDLPAIEAAFEAGARAIVLCNPHNPTGACPTADELRALVVIAARSDVGIISDEVHAPLTLPGRHFTPLLSLGDQRSLTVTSASKSWNVAGLKCAVLIGGDQATATALARLPVELRHPGHLGVLATMAAFTSATTGDGWLDRVTRHLERQHERAKALLAAAIPAVRIPEVDAGYLLWADCRDLGLGASPATTFLERGQVALSPGLEFGSQGSGYVRLNVATSGQLLLEAVRRMRAALTGARTLPQDRIGSGSSEPVTR